MKDYRWWFSTGIIFVLLDLKANLYKAYSKVDVVLAFFYIGGEVKVLLIWKVFIMLTKVGN